MEILDSASWYLISQDEFNHLPLFIRDSNRIFFIKDNGQIYRGNQLFTGSVAIYNNDELPSIPAVDKLYINSKTLEGKIYRNKKWITVIKPVTDEISEDNLDPVSGKAVYDYIEEYLGVIENGAY